MNETIKNTLKGLVAEIEELNKIEKEIDIDQAFMPALANIGKLEQIQNFKQGIQNKINTIIKGL